MRYVPLNDQLSFYNTPFLLSNPAEFCTGTFNIIARYAGGEIMLDISFIRHK